MDSMGYQNGRNRYGTADDLNSEDDWVRRVIIKLNSAAAPPTPPQGMDMVASVDDLWSNLRSRFGITTIQPYTSLAGEELQQAVPAARANDENYDPVDFASYFAISVPNDVAAEDIVAEATQWQEVESAEIEPHFTDAFPEGANPRLNEQGYVEAAPAGVDARAAWATPGGTGHGVKFIDVEQGWLLDAQNRMSHEDLSGSGARLLYGSNFTSSRPHGTGAFGIVCMQDNGVGGVGIAPECTSNAVGCRDNSGTYDLLGAIVAATNRLDRGDVMLVEQQALDGDNPGPVEVSKPIYDAIRTALPRASSWWKQAATRAPIWTLGVTPYSAAFSTAPIRPSEIRARSSSAPAPPPRLTGVSASHPQARASTVAPGERTSSPPRPMRQVPPISTPARSTALPPPRRWSRASLFRCRPWCVSARCCP